ncbi:hypothetical protein [Streptomyces sp. AC495_CC817]|uniref:hypothetical protein n=1 Tax=Streptomyces sp. AC495_CC817 TaxID=2823900 RepID=UPI001C257ADD|nr:hypothetical protein [Streptomyces sp. AC495_CC817]
MTTPDQQPSQPPQPPQNNVPPAPEAAAYAPPSQPTAPGGYPVAPAAPAYAAPESVPGKGLAIAGLILAIVAPIVGFILSLVARSKLKKAGAPTGLATAGIIIGAILTVVWIIIIVVSVLGLIALASVCGQLGPGITEYNGVTYSCG